MLQSVSNAVVRGASDPIGITSANLSIQVADRTGRGLRSSLLSRERDSSGAVALHLVDQLGRCDDSPQADADRYDPVPAAQMAWNAGVAVRLAAYLRWMQMGESYEDLFDIENAPGAGVARWGKVAQRQVDRVREANYRHRLHHSPNDAESVKDENAMTDLEMDVYFLVLAVRRVLMFHDAISAQTEDDRLAPARAEFLKVAPHAKDIRDFYEHLDEYVLGTGRKQKKGHVHARVAPVLFSRWDCDNVEIRFGGALRMDITLAGLAAVKLAEGTAAVWEEHLERLKLYEDPPDSSDGIRRTLEVRLSPSTLIGGEDEAHQLTIGVLRHVIVREATPEEIATRDEDAA